MNIIYDGSTAQRLRKILDRKDLYITCDIEGDVVALCLKQQLKNGTERICGHASFHIPEEK